MFWGGGSRFTLCISDPCNYLVLIKGMKRYTVCTTHASMKIIRKYIRLALRKRWQVKQSCSTSLMDKSGEKALKIQEHKHKHKHKNTCTQVHGRTSTTSPK